MLKGQKKLERDWLRKNDEDMALRLSNDCKYSNIYIYFSASKYATKPFESSLREG